MSQVIYKGIENLARALDDSTNVLLVCDSSFPFLSIKDNIESIGVPYVKFDEFTPNPLYEDVCKGVDLFNITKCDTIVAVGGGSSIDVAKCIKLFCKMSMDEVYLEQEYKDTGIKLIAIPTTAGTGSESTRYAVVYYDGKKQSVTHDSIIPNIAILEPTVLKTLPLYQKKCTMLDAYCQGIESWWSINSTEESKELSKKAVETITKWWREYIFDNSDNANEAIMGAANLAGQAICITQTTAPHAFSYKITSLYKLPHGHAVAIGLPVIWEYMISHMEKCIDPRGEEYLNKIFRQISLAIGVTTGVAEAVSEFKLMLDILDINSPLSKSCTRDVEILSTSVNTTRLKNNPILLNKHAIREIYTDILK